MTKKVKQSSKIVLPYIEEHQSTTRSKKKSSDFNKVFRGKTN
jgi:hypothetical protein